MNKTLALLQILYRKCKVALKLIKSGKLPELISGLFLQRRILSIKIPKQALRPSALLLERIDIVVTQKCTLKCKSCSNLMQYFPTERLKEIPLSNICRDFDLLMQRVDFIRIIEIMGGEPLLFKELPALMTHISKYRHQYGLLRITTNGTIVPSDEVLKTAVKLNTVFMVSDYGELSANLDKLKEKLRRYRIPYRIAKVAWYECRKIVDGASRSEADISKLYQKCDKLCNTLVNGRFYHCPFLAHGDTLSAFPDSSFNYIDLLDKNVTKEHILSYKADAAIPPGCRYCSGGHSFNGQSIPTAEQTNTPLAYKEYV